MRVIHLLPGSGNAYYCGNCVRDGALLGALNRCQGVHATVVPLYLPLLSTDSHPMTAQPLFFGAVNMYLKESFPNLGRALAGLDGFIEALLDSRMLLSFAARQAGSVRSSGLEAMTLAMLKGDSEFFKKELSRLVEWLLDDARPDVIHLSNMLISGLAVGLKRALGVPVVCSLQDEDAWLDDMVEPFRSEAWSIIRRNAAAVDRFLPVSDWYKQFMAAKLDLPDQRFTIVPPGIDIESPANSKPGRVPVIGFLSRLSSRSGLELLVDAYLRFRRTKAGSAAILRVSGGYTRDDAAFLKSITARIAREGGIFDLVEHFSAKQRSVFLASLTLLCVPNPQPEASGLFLIEAMAAGVPLVVPDHGGYSEILRKSISGILIAPQALSADGLAALFGELVSNPGVLAAYSRNGKEAARQHYSIEVMAARLVEIYRELA